MSCETNLIRGMEKRVREYLADTKIIEVAEKTGLTRQTVARIRDGDSNSSYTVETLIKLVENMTNGDGEDGLFKNLSDNVDSKVKYEGEKPSGLVFNLDVRKLLAEIQDETVDLIVTDPPYRTISGGNKSKNRPKGILSSNDGKIFQHNDLNISDYIEDFYRVLKKQSHLYLFVNQLNLHEYMDEVVRAGFKIHSILIWHKNTKNPNRWYMKNCEYIIFARKGKAFPINDCGSATLQSHKNLVGDEKLHPTEKPYSLIRNYISNSSGVGDIVLDPFCGSGVVGEVCKDLGRKYIISDIDPEYYEKSKTRLLRK